MAITVLPGPVIQAGQSLSDPLDCSGGTIMRLFMPAIWTPACLSFQVSSDGVNFADVYSIQGQEIRIMVVPGSAIVLAVSNGAGQAARREVVEPPDLRGAPWIKVRSGSITFPVVQAAQRQFQTTLEA